MGSLNCDRLFTRLTTRYQSRNTLNAHLCEAHTHIKEPFWKVSNNSDDINYLILPLEWSRRGEKNSNLKIWQQEIVYNPT